MVQQERHVFLRTVVSTIILRIGMTWQKIGRIALPICKNDLELIVLNKQVPTLDSSRSFRSSVPGPLLRG